MLDDRVTSAPRPRPLGERAVERLYGQEQELARRWALALLAERSLERLAQLRLELLASEGPTLITGILRTLAAEDELERPLDGREPAGDGCSPGALLPQLIETGGAGEIVAAVEALRGVLWAALLEDPQSPPEAVAPEVCDRLAHVCFALAARALDGPAAEPVRSESSEQPGDRPPAPAARPAPAAPGARPVRIVDEHRPTPIRSVLAQAPRRHRARAGRPHATLGVTQGWEQLACREGDAAPEQIAIRDERHGHGPGAWIGSIGHELERFRADGAPFAVLLVEVGDGDGDGDWRESAGQAALANRVEELLRGELRPPQAAGNVARDIGATLPEGSLTRERAGRYWLVLRRTDHVRASAVVERLMGLVGGARGGAEPKLAVGSAVCPDDGRDAPALAAHADLGLYRTRSAGRAQVGGPGRAERPA
jgi:hypothetical protein